MTKKKMVNIDLSTQNSSTSEVEVYFREKDVGCKNKSYNQH
ncbi:MAG: hypothetical protein ABIG86_00780 [Patescibacteria group bacterium]